MFGVDTPDVKFVTLPRSVKKIGSGAFRNLDGLTGLSMSTVVDSIGNYAFENCVSLEQFVFGPFVNKIGEGAFKNCVSLSTLRNFENIPTTEFVGTFEGCAMLINVTLPSVTTKIEKCSRIAAICLKLCCQRGFVILVKAHLRTAQHSAQLTFLHLFLSSE